MHLVLVALFALIGLLIGGASYAYQLETYAEWTPYLAGSALFLSALAGIIGGRLPAGVSQRTWLTGQPTIPVAPRHAAAITGMVSLGILFEWALGINGIAVGFAMAGALGAIFWAMASSRREGRTDSPTLGNSARSAATRRKPVLALAMAAGLLATAAIAFEPEALPLYSLGLDGTAQCSGTQWVDVDLGARNESLTMAAQPAGILLPTTVSGPTWDLPASTYSVEWSVTWDGAPERIYIAGDTPDGHYIGEEVRSGEAFTADNLRDQTQLTWSARPTGSYTEDIELRFAGKFTGESLAPRTDGSCQAADGRPGATIA